MKYYLIVGEASGDLHASNLMRALKEQDPQADFRFFGGDLMASEGGVLVRHYRELAYMGFIQVALHAHTLLQGIRLCKEDVTAWNPDVLILVDYPGFNLKIAKFIHSHTCIPVYYYISPKIWAWKKRRIKSIRRDIDELFSILPFEVPFYEKLHYPIHYIGNPCADAVNAYRQKPIPRTSFIITNHLDGKPILALLAGSRKAEIRDNLPRMVKAASTFPDFMPVIAGAPSIDESFYRSLLKKMHIDVPVVFGQTYPLLDNAHAALVTSGTATLETALFGIPQIVCYYIRCGKLVSFLRKLFLKVPFISLVNLIADHEVVPELVANKMNVSEIQQQLTLLLYDTPKRAAQLKGYDEIKSSVGEAGCSSRAATKMLECLHAQAKPQRTR